MLRRSAKRGAAVLLFGLSLAGCASPSLPSFSSLFGSNTSAGDASASAQANVVPPNFECPSVTVRSGAATLTSSTDPADPNAMNMRYQVSIGTTARECRVVGNTVSVKVGMQGRVILGPQGHAGTVEVPIRYAVVHDGVPPKTIATRLERVSVTVPPDDTNVLFSHVVESVEFPMPKGSEIDSYVVYIGFDPVAAQEMDRRKAPPRPRRQTQG
jgi:hypothetical protein